MDRENFFPSSLRKQEPFSKIKLNIQIKIPLKLEKNCSASNSRNKSAYLLNA